MLVHFNNALALFFSGFSITRNLYSTSIVRTLSHSYNLKTVLLGDFILLSLLSFSLTDRARKKLLSQLASWFLQIGIFRRNSASKIVWYGSCERTYWCKDKLAVWKSWEEMVEGHPFCCPRVDVTRATYREINTLFLLPFVLSFLIVRQLKMTERLWRRFERIERLVHLYYHLFPDFVSAPVRCLPPEF